MSGELLARADLRASEREEDEFYGYVLRRGWSVDYIGQRVWCDGVKRVVRRHYDYLAHTPDLLIARGECAYLVEVVNAHGKRQPNLEVGKLVSLNLWLPFATVMIADVSTHTAWAHQPAWFRKDLASNVRTVHFAPGSGDPYVAVMRPEYATTWDVAFG